MRHEDVLRTNMAGLETARHSPFLQGVVNMGKVIFSPSGVSNN
jgi:hypothetical protein